MASKSAAAICTIHMLGLHHQRPPDVLGGCQDLEVALYLLAVLRRPTLVVHPSYGERCGRMLGLRSHSCRSSEPAVRQVV